MIEDEARNWIAVRWGSDALARLDRYAALIIDENARQNLIAASTIDMIWARHMVDSAQLLTLAEKAGEGAWLDIGSGGGFPGIVVAILGSRKTYLVEPRRKRAEFLSAVCSELSLNAEVICCKVQNASVSDRVDVISARAVTDLSIILDATRHIVSESTLFLLPKGRSAKQEVRQARQHWRGVFHVEQSVTAEESLIVTAQGVVRR